MPILTPEEIVNLQTNVRKAIMEAAPDEALDLLVKVLPNARSKYDQVLLLKSRQAEIVQHDVNNTLSEEQLDLLRNNLAADVLLFINYLTAADFQPKPASRPGLKPGHLLYQVPTTMVLQTTYDCLVRVAEELNQVLEGLVEDEGIIIEDIGLTEVMEVEIIDPGGPDNPVFEIMLLSDGEQVVDEYSYTEWVFNVRPLREGQHQLILKISVLLTINGKERTKNVILRRPISIVAMATEEVPMPKLRRMVASMNEEMVVLPPKELGASQASAPATINPPIPPPKTAKKEDAAVPPQSSPTPSPRSETNRKSRRGSFLSLAASLLVLVFAGIWVVSSNSWEDLIPGDVGITDPDPPVTIEDTTKTLLPPKRLLPDSLEID